jgi:hypothetical protein
MKLFVFTNTSTRHSSLIANDMNVTQWKALLNNHMVWEDTSDDGLADTEETIRAEYLEPNGVYATKIGRVGPRFWWVKISEEKTAMNDFYCAGEPGSEEGLSWHTFYTFTNTAGDDCISKVFEYIPCQDVIAGLRSYNKYISK